MKTIKSLINPGKKVYVKMNSADDCKRFFSLAENEYSAPIEHLRRLKLNSVVGVN